MPAALKRRVSHDIDVYIQHAQAGSTQHAIALLAYFLAGGDDPHVLAYVDAARERYEADTDREHRGMERALMLLRPRSGTGRDRRAKMTDDASIEAVMEFERYLVARILERGARGAEKYAVSKTAAALKVSESSVRQAIAAHKKSRRDQ
jgi:hypothetical protein